MLQRRARQIVTLAKVTPTGAIAVSASDEFAYVDFDGMLLDVVEEGDLGLLIIRTSIGTWDGRLKHPVIRQYVLLLECLPNTP